MKLELSIYNIHLNSKKNMYITNEDSFNLESSQIYPI